jgi:pantetheine-phosphate adenylyltransferase
MKTAIYPLSADPITNGHIDIIKRASKIFDKVIVAIGNNFSKKYLFNIKEREEIAKQVLKNYENLEILNFDSLLTDFAKEQNVNLIVRGFRNSNDYLHELNLYQNYHSQDSRLEFINLFSNKEFISSTAVKEIASLHGDVHNQVPLLVKAKLEEKIHNQKIIAVTGLIGSGKSYFIKKFIQKNPQEQISHISFDALSHTALSSLEIKKEVVKELALRAQEVDVSNLTDLEFRQKIAKEVFLDKQKLSKLEDILLPRILLLLRKELKNKTGLIFLEIPLLVEKKLSYLSNNRTILINSKKSFRYSNLIKKGFSETEIKNREAHQFDYFTKKNLLLEQIKIHKFGNLLEINNTQNGFSLTQDFLKTEDLIQYFNF